MKNNIDYSKNGLIIAPAGHGKTEDIVNQLIDYKDIKKVLILTHTNVGVQELKERVRRKNVDLKIMNISTIASFSLKYIKMFPKLSGYDSTKEIFENQIYEQMVKLLKNSHIKEIIKNSYSQIFVDEYQDCSIQQHQMIKKICEIINYKLYGDPLQSIYDFNETPIDMYQILNENFELIGKLEYPWRWYDKNVKLGNWILETRNKLERNDAISLENIPHSVAFIKTQDIDNTLRTIGFKYLEKNISNIILTKFPYQTKKYVKFFGGKYKMQEEVECKDLKKFVQLIDNLNRNDLLVELFKVLKSSYTGISQFKNIIDKVNVHSYDFSRLKNNTELSKIILEFIDGPEFSIDKISSIIKIVENSPGIKLCRFELMDVMKKILFHIQIANGKNAVDTLQQITSIRINKQFKYLISRVLLVKGLQFKNVILVEPEEMTKQEFYVAISRATDSLTIITKNDNIAFDK